jgi:hypothetical protein
MKRLCIILKILLCVNLIITGVYYPAYASLSDAQEQGIPAKEFFENDNHGISENVPENPYSEDDPNKVHSRHVTFHSESEEHDQTAIPRPGAIILLGGGLLIIGFYVRKKIKK